MKSFNKVKTYIELWDLNLKTEFQPIFYHFDVNFSEIRKLFFEFENILKFTLHDEYQLLLIQFLFYNIFKIIFLILRDLSISRWFGFFKFLLIKSTIDWILNELKLKIINQDYKSQKIRTEFRRNYSIVNLKKNIITWNWWLDLLN
jgi:hypothetical protein